MAMVFFSKNWSKCAIFQYPWNTAEEWFEKTGDNKIKWLISQQYHLLSLKREFTIQSANPNSQKWI